MILETIPYHDYIESVPKEGRHILAQQPANDIIVYQAYNHAISDFALENQCFGGSSYSYTKLILECRKKVR